MPWETRTKDGNRYFYHSRRFNGRVVKDYYGSGPEAELAAEVFAAAKEKRSLNREKLDAAKAGLKLVDRQMEQLRLAPLEADHAEQTKLSASSSASPPPLPTPESVLSRARELLEARQAGDPTAEAELTDLIDRFPSLMHRFGDLGRLAHAKWLSLIVGKDTVMLSATIKKMEDLRSQFTANDNPMSRLLVERILATWLQLTYATGKMAEAGSLDRASFKFYSQLQEKAQRQHMQAIRTWNQMQNMPRRDAG